MRTVMLMVPACPESHFLGRASRLRPASGCGVRQLEADCSIGESEQKAEMTFGDFGASVSASALSAGKLYAAGR